MVYPIFEYSLIAYIVAGYFQIKNDFDNNKVPAGIMTSAKYLFWVKMILVAWFRMIFVIAITQDPIPFFGTEISAVAGHTLGFFGLQFALVLIAVENVCYIYYMEKTMWFMSSKVMKVMAVIYLVLLSILTGMKISWASTIFIYGKPWITGAWPHLFDRAWLFLAAFLPLVFSWHGMRTEPYLVLRLSNEPIDTEPAGRMNCLRRRNVNGAAL